MTANKIKVTVQLHKKKQMLHAIILKQQKFEKSFFSNERKNQTAGERLQTKTQKKKLIFPKS